MRRLKNLKERYFLVTYLTSLSSRDDFIKSEIINKFACILVWQYLGKTNNTDERIQSYLYLISLISSLEIVLSLASQEQNQKSANLIDELYL